mgnify:CR=1 FL=1
MKLDHIAIIMDGNRRWASANNLPSYEGHKKGAENLWNIINNIQEFKLKFLTVFVFSTENWKRSRKEISFFHFQSVKEISSFGDLYELRYLVLLLQPSKALRHARQI